LPDISDYHFSNLDDAISRKIFALKELIDKGAEIHTVSVDVADEDQMSDFLGNWQRNYPPLKGIIHLAGIVKPLTIHQLSAENLDSVMRSKVFGTWLLHDLTDWAELDFFVLFSSAASVLNPPLLGSYAAANAFLNAVAQYRNKLGQKILSIDWGFWSGKGMAVQYMGPANRTLVPKGMKSIPTGKGLDTLEFLMKQDLTQISVIPTDWQEFGQSDPRIRNMPLLSDLVGELQSDSSLADELRGVTTSSFESQPDEINIHRILELPKEERIDYLTDYIKSIVGKALLMETDEIDPVQNLMELGIDSLMVMELTASLERDFQLTVYPREVFERPNIKELVVYLESELIRLEGDNLSKLRELRKPEPRIGRSIKTNSFGLPTEIFNYHHPERIHSPIVFILSSPRAGSTLLRVMLAGHPDLFCPPELHLLPFEDMRTRNELLGGSYLDEGLTRSIMEIHSIDSATANDLIGGWIDKRSPIEEIYGSIQKYIDPQILIDKSPSYALSMDVLERAELMFENPKYILLSRHPYSVMDSFEKNRFDKLLGYETEDPLSLAEDIWATMNSNVLDFFDGLPISRFTVVKYESLVKESKKVMMEVCDFLGVGYNEALLKPYEIGRMTDGIHHESKSIGDPNFLKHQIIEESLGDVWRHVKFRVRLGGFARRVSRELGYDLADISPQSTINLFKEKTSDSSSKSRGIKPLSRESRRMNSSDHKPSEITDSLKDELFGKDE
jgi:acyl carrier protein